MSNNAVLETDQIRQLANVVHLSGILAELSTMSEGKTKDNIPYLSFNGKVQCGDEAIYTVPFRVFIKSKKTNGEDSKNYANVKDWYSKAIPMTKDVENATRVDMRGSLTDNPYVNANGELVESTQFNMQLFGSFKSYAAEITLEGAILAVSEEVRDDAPTGRGRLRFFTRDIFRNNIELRNIVVQSPDIDPVVNMTTLEEVGYRKGTTTSLFIDLLPAKAVAPARKGGLGKQHVTEGNNYLEWVLTGCADIADAEHTLSSKIVKAALSVRSSRLEEIKRAGYLGSKNATPTRTVGLGSKKASTSAIDNYDVDVQPKVKPASDMSPVGDEDDFPF